MEQFQVSREEAKKHLKLADHMLTQTYPLVKDPKLLLAVLQNLFRALDHTMSAILYYERLFKRIPPFQDTFDSRFNMFKARMMRRYNLNPEYVTLIQKVKETPKEHQRSPVEFVRDGKFVICSDNYKLRTISFEEMKKFISQAKSFINEMEGMVSKNDRIFRRSNF